MTAPATLAPKTVGDFTQQNASTLLLGLAGKGFCGTVQFEPNALKLRFLYGEIVGAAGGEPIGSILVRRGAITEAQLVDAMQGQGRRSLGQILTGKPLNLEPDVLVNALETQIKLAVNSLLSEPPMNYALFDETLEILEFSPRVAVQDALTEASSAAAEVEAGVLGLGAILRMKLQSSQPHVQLSADQWAVCALLNGRRTLQAVMRHFEITRLSLPSESARLRAYRAAVQLFQMGWIEPAAVNGLQTLVMRKLDVPRSGINAKAAIFLDALDGTSSAYQIAVASKIELIDAATIVTNLYRSNFAAVLSGKRELERLLEEY
jgi:hypothetical protein